jgi:hypothetical protein
MEVGDYFIAVSAVGTLALAGVAFWTIWRQRVERARQIKIQIANEIYKWAEEGNKIFHDIRFQHNGNPQGDTLVVDSLLSLYRKRKHVVSICDVIDDDTFADIVKTTALSLERYVEQRPAENKEEFNYAESAEECSGFLAALSWVAHVLSLKLTE